MEIVGQKKNHNNPKFNKLKYNNSNCNMHGYNSLKKITFLNRKTKLKIKKPIIAMNCLKFPKYLKNYKDKNRSKQDF